MVVERETRDQGGIYLRKEVTGGVGTVRYEGEDLVDETLLNAGVLAVIMCIQYCDLSKYDSGKNGIWVVFRIERWDGW